MMFKSFFYCFFIAHILGDFYFQSRQLSDDKNQKYRYVLLHSFIYAIILMICIIPVFSLPLMVATIILFVSHFVVDTVKYFIIRNAKAKKKSIVYVIDQCVHIGFAAIASFTLSYLGYTIDMIPQFKKCLFVFTSSPKNIFLWCGLLLIVSKPANITIKQLIALYKPQQDEGDSQIRAGAFIGTLERLLILIFISLSQYSAIGFIFTAKSVARYNKISEDKQFAEYYLLGTLLSTVFAIGAYYLMF